MSVGEAKSGTGSGALFRDEKPQPVVMAAASAPWPPDEDLERLVGPWASHHQSDGTVSSTLNLTGKSYELAFPTFPGMRGAFMSSIRIPSASP
jgi:hypothetical protein